MEITWGNQKFVLLKKFLLYRFLVVMVIMPGLATLGLFLTLWWGMSTPLMLYTAASFMAMYLISGFGITIGYHRFFTHESFRARLPVRIALAIMGSFAWQQSLLSWVPIHRIHHAFADIDGDPHSPIVAGGNSFRKRMHGFFWAYLGWIISPYEYPPEITENYRRDLRKQRLIRFQEKTHHVWAVGGFVLPAVFAFPFWGWQGSLQVLLIVGALRVVCLWHVTWFINSWAHLWGTRPHKLKNGAANFALWFFGLGEALHNNHHADERCAWHGWRWYDLDASKWIIWTLEKMRLVYDVRRPRIERVLA